MFLPDVDNSSIIPGWQLSKSYESLLFNFGDQVELKRAYNCIWSHFGGKQFTSAMRSINYNQNSGNEKNDPTILEVVFTNDQLTYKALNRGLRYNNHVIIPVLNVRSDLIYIAYPIFDLPLNEQEAEEMLFDEFTELEDDTQGGPQSSNRSINYYDSDDNNIDDSDDLDDEEKEGVVDVVLGADSVSGLYNGTATVIVRRVLPPLVSEKQLVDQQRHRHLLPTNVRVYHMYCTSCQMLDNHHDGNCQN